MTATYVQTGNSIDYTPAADVPAGAVIVVNDLVGIAKRPIPANTLGALTVDDVFELPKASGGGTAIDFGVIVYWNIAAQEVTATAAGNKLLGKCVKAAADADTKVRVRLSQ